MHSNEYEIIFVLYAYLQVSQARVLLRMAEAPPLAAVRPCSHPIVVLRYPGTVIVLDTIHMYVVAM